MPYDEFAGIAAFGAGIVAITKHGRIWYIKITENEEGFKIIYRATLLGQIGEITGELL